jgi:hypothetical protein
MPDPTLRRIYHQEEYKCAANNPPVTPGKPAVACVVTDRAHSNWSCVRIELSP